MLGIFARLACRSTRSSVGPTGCSLQECLQLDSSDYPLSPCSMHLADTPSHT
jgi:hypothetical protein